MSKLKGFILSIICFILSVFVAWHLSEFYSIFLLIILALLTITLVLDIMFILCEPYKNFILKRLHLDFLRVNYIVEKSSSKINALKSYLKSNISTFVVFLICASTLGLLVMFGKLKGFLFF